MTLDLASDMDNVFLKSGFEEDVIHVSPTSTETTVKAIVFRGGNETFSVGRGQRSADLARFDFEVYVSITNVALPQINKTAFKIYDKVGDTSRKSHLVAKIISADSGGYRLGLA